MVKVNKTPLPKVVDISYHTITFKLLDQQVALEVGDQQGSYVARDQVIFLDESIIEQGGARAVSLVLHEIGHAIYYIYNLKDREEEPTVDSFANAYTEVFRRNKQLTKWMVENLNGTI
jgi:hypothetical protein